MPDLLTHALLAYVVVRIISLRYDWLTPAYATVAMAGAFVPDLTKIALLFPSEGVEGVLSVPFDWGALHTAGGTAISILVGVLLVAPDERRRVGLLLSVGAVSHLLADGLLRNPSGHSYAMLWPLSRYHPPTPGLYLSTDPEPTIVAVIAALLVWYVFRE